MILNKNQNRREFIKNAAKAILTLSSLSVFPLTVSCSATKQSENNAEEVGYFDNGYFDNGYFDNGYFDTGYLDTGILDNGFFDSGY